MIIRKGSTPKNSDSDSSTASGAAALPALVKKVGLEELREKIVRDEGNRRRDGVKHYVLSRTRDTFMMFVKWKKLELQSCKQISVEHETNGINWSSPLSELWVEEGWQENKHAQFIDEAWSMIHRACRDKRISRPVMFKMISAIEGVDLQ